MKERIAKLTDAQKAAIRDAASRAIRRVIDEAIGLAADEEEMARTCAIGKAINDAVRAAIESVDAINEVAAADAGEVGEAAMAKRCGAAKPLP